MRRMVKLLVPPRPIGYAEFLTLQSDLLLKNKDHLLVFEHDKPVYTAGRQSAGFTAREGPRLASLGATCLDVDRGGKITWHGPGQICIYPLLDLSNYQKNLRWYVERLEAVLMRACLDFGVHAERRSTSDEIGVWTSNAKIGFIGMRNKRWSTSFGASLNVSNDLSWFNHILPCGLEGIKVTSLSEQLSRNTSVTDAKNSLINGFEAEFNAKFY